MAKKLNISDRQYRELYVKGLSDIRIAIILNCTKGTVRKWRNTNKLPPNFKPTVTKYNSWSKEEFKRLYSEGLTDIKIAIQLNTSEKAINSYRNKLELSSNQSHNIVITKKLEEILVGTLLGDGHISCRANSKERKLAKTGRLVFAHKIEHKEYCFFKYNLLKPLFNREPQYNEQTRNGKVNKSYYATSISTKSLVEYHKIFYKDFVKIIPSNIRDYFTVKSLALLFMDDGYNGQYFSLCNFDEESIFNLQDLLLDKWNLRSSIHKNNILYIPTKSRHDFINLIKHLIIPTMTYKIDVLVKLGELLESPKFILVDNI